MYTPTIKNQQNVFFRPHLIKYGITGEATASDLAEQLGERVYPPLLPYISRRCRKIKVRYLSTKCDGIGMNNDGGGMEIYSSSLQQSRLLTIGKSRITTIHSYPSVRSRQCILFDQFTDFLRFWPRYISEYQETLNILSSDILIMNNVSNLPEYLREIVQYKAVLTCFADDDFGNTLRATIHSIIPTATDLNLT